MVTQTFISAIYGLVALFGTLTYTYAGWKNSGEPFDLSKLLDTMGSSGLLSVIASAGGLAAGGFTLYSLVAAFFLGTGIDTAYNHVLKVTKPKKQ